MAAPLATGGYADDLVRASIARSYKELNDIDQLTTSSLATALGRRALRLNPKTVTLLSLQGKHSSRDLRAALLGDWKTQSAWSPPHDTGGAQRTIEGTMTTERAARCAAARAAFAQYTKYFRSKAPFHHRRLVFQVTVVGDLTFGLEVAPLTEVDIRILNGCLTSLSLSVPRRTRTHRRQSRYRKGDADG